MLALVLLTICAAATASPFSNSTYGFSTTHLAKEDYLFLRTIPRTKATSPIPGFHYIYVDSTGAASWTANPSIYQVEIAGSPYTSTAALQAAAGYVAKMTRNMPLSIFASLCTKSSLGIFTAQEKLIVYPEYAYMANGNCGSSCSGSCQQTCTFDGRKYQDIAGVGGQRAVILDDNVLCTANDPYNNRENILAHEFTHTIHQFALSSQDRANILAAYNNAKYYQTWTLSSYAMSNEMEYFAEAATVFFGVNVYSNVNTGGMNVCGSQYCTSEMAARSRLQSHDPSLFNILSYVFTNNRPQLTSGLTVCPSPLVVG